LPNAYRRLVNAWLALVVLALPFSGQALDSHFADQAAGPLYRKSAFAHGYIHGYEDGYRAGDRDLQMGRERRGLENDRELPPAKSAHRAEFGRRQDFLAGYREGYRVAYGDSYAGRPFRAVAAGRAIAHGLPQVQPDAAPSRTFDSGFIAGYTKGRKSGLEDARLGAHFQPLSDGCAGQQLLSEASRHSGDYCEGLKRGYILGYGDGYANQRLRLGPPPHSTAAVH
jgi:hypothetical protein